MKFILYMEILLLGFIWRLSSMLATSLMESERPKYQYSSSTNRFYKQVLVRKPVLKDTLVFLVKAHLKLVLGYSSKISYCKVDFCNVHVKLHQVSIEI